jgi:protein-tyrosine-phosphatase
MFNKLNKNKKIIAESAGIIGSIHNTPKSVIDILKEKGYTIKRKIARRVDCVKIKDYDLIIITADNVNPLFFKDSFNKKIIWWKITDCMDTDINGIKKRVDEIETKVKNLVEKLKTSS